MITYKGLLPGEEMSINTYNMRVAWKDSDREGKCHGLKSTETETHSQCNSSLPS